MFDLGKAIMDAVGTIAKTIEEESRKQEAQKKEAAEKSAPQTDHPHVADSAPRTEKAPAFNTQAKYVPSFEFGRVWRFNRTLLSAQDQSLYDAINAATSRCIPSVKIACDGTPDVQHLMAVTLALIEDDPSLFYVDSGITVKYNGRVAEIEFKYNRFMDGKDQYLDLMKKKARNIYETRVKNCSTTYEAELAIHDYFIETMTYDGSDDVAAHSMAGPLITGKGVCEGISEAYCFVANACGIKTSMMSGKLENENHRWNIVEIGGKRYHLDVTSDLGGMHAFFNCSDEKLRETHSFEKKSNCRATDLSYYTVNRSNFSTMKDAEAFLRQNAANVPSSFEFRVESGADAQSIGRAIQSGLRRNARISITSKSTCYKVDLK